MLSTHSTPNRDADNKQIALGAPFLFLLGIKTGQILSVTPSLLADLFGPDWSLRVGALRHFVRSHLLKSNCSGELINALLGHGERGEAAWSKFSTLAPRAWRVQLHEAIEPLLRELGLDAVCSPLLGPVA